MVALLDARPVTDTQAFGKHLYGQRHWYRTSIYLYIYRDQSCGETTMEGYDYVDSCWTELTTLTQSSSRLIWFIKAGMAHGQYSGYILEALVSYLVVRQPWRAMTTWTLVGLN
jgi:hypothetical protein